MPLTEAEQLLLSRYQSQIEKAADATLEAQLHAVGAPSSPHSTEARCAAHKRAEAEALLHNRQLLVPVAAAKRREVHDCITQPVHEAEQRRRRAMAMRTDGGSGAELTSSSSPSATAALTLFGAKPPLSVAFPIDVRRGPEALQSDNDLTNGTTHGSDAYYSAMLSTAYSAAMAPITAPPIEPFEIPQVMVPARNVTAMDLKRAMSGDKTDASAGADDGDGAEGEKTGERKQTSSLSPSPTAANTKRRTSKSGSSSNSRRPLLSAAVHNPVSIVIPNSVKVQHALLKKQSAKMVEEEEKRKRLRVIAQRSRAEEKRREGLEEGVRSPPPSLPPPPRMVLPPLPKHNGEASLGSAFGAVNCSVELSSEGGMLSDRPKDILNPTAALSSSRPHLGSFLPPIATPHTNQSASIPLAPATGEQAPPITSPPRKVLLLANGSPKRKGAVAPSPSSLEKKKTIGQSDVKDGGAANPSGGALEFGTPLKRIHTLAGGGGGGTATSAPARLLVAPAVYDAIAAMPPPQHYGAMLGVVATALESNLYLSYSAKEKEDARRLLLRRQGAIEQHYKVGFLVWTQRNNLHHHLQQLQASRGSEDVAPKSFAALMSQRSFGGNTTMDSKSSSPPASPAATTAQLSLRTIAALFIGFRVCLVEARARRQLREQRQRMTLDTAMLLDTSVNNASMVSLSPSVSGALLRSSMRDSVSPLRGSTPGDTPTPTKTRRERIDGGDAARRKPPCRIVRVNNGLLVDTLFPANSDGAPQQGTALCHRLDPILESQSFTPSDWLLRREDYLASMGEEGLAPSVSLWPKPATYSTPLSFYAVLAAVCPKAINSIQQGCSELMTASPIVPPPSSDANAANGNAFYTSANTNGSPPAAVMALMSSIKPLSVADGIMAASRATKVDIPEISLSVPLVSNMDGTVTSNASFASSTKVVPPPPPPRVKLTDSVYGWPPQTTSPPAGTDAPRPQTGDATSANALLSVLSSSDEVGGERDSGRVANITDDASFAAGLGPAALLGAAYQSNNSPLVIPPTDILNLFEMLSDDKEAFAAKYGPTPEGGAGATVGGAGAGGAAAVANGALHHRRSVSMAKASPNPLMERSTTLRSVHTTMRQSVADALPREAQQQAGSAAKAVGGGVARGGGAGGGLMGGATAALLALSPTFDDSTIDALFTEHRRVMHPCALPKLLDHYFTVLYPRLASYRPQSDKLPLLVRTYDIDRDGVFSLSEFASMMIKERFFRYKIK